MKKDPSAVPFSYPVKVGHISANPVEVRVSADKDELKALAESWNVVSVDSLHADLQINRWKRDGIRVKGRVQARIVQACVVTLEPVESDIDEAFEQIFVPENSKLARHPANDAGEMVLDPDGPDLPETFTGDTIDAGEIVAEFAALAIDPYPRKEGAEFEGHIEDTGENDRKPSAFAALKDWKKD
ncbi:YceD family protein [Rhizobium sp. KDH_Rht_773_N]